MDRALTQLATSVFMVISQRLIFTLRQCAKCAKLAWQRSTESLALRRKISMCAASPTRNRAFGLATKGCQG